MADASFEDLDRDAESSDASAALLLKDGEVVWSYVNSGSALGELFHTASVTKFVVGLCVARAVHLGHLESIDEGVGRWIGEWSHDQRADISLRQLMTHTSGLAVSWPQAGGTTVTAAALSLEAAAPPGTTVAYNNHGAQLVAEVVRRAVRVPIDEYAAAHLFAPLGIDTWAWNRDADDLPFGMSALQLRVEDLARIGMLSCDRGAWHGAQLFAEDWALSNRQPGRAFGLFEMLIPAVDVLIDLTDATDIDDDLRHVLAASEGERVPINGAGSLFSMISRRLGASAVQSAWTSLRCGAPNLGFDRPQLQAYGHDGSGGQHLWVVPSVHGVAVRLRRMDERSSAASTASAFRELALEALIA